MSPREEVIGDCRLILGDCREIASTLVWVDAVVSDPPYGIAYAKGAGGKGKHAVRNMEAIAGSGGQLWRCEISARPCQHESKYGDDVK